MKKIVIAFIILLVGCASDQEKEAFNSIGDYYGAKVTYTKGFSSNAGEKDHKYITLKITGSPYLETEQPKKIAVYAAVLLYVNLSDEEINKYTDIEVSLFKNETEKEPIYKGTYPLETIKNVAKQSEKFQKAQQFLMEGTPDQIYDMLNKDFKTEEQKKNFVAVIDEMKTTRSGVKSVKLLGVGSLVDNATKDRYINFEGKIKWGDSTTTAMTITTTEDTSLNFVENINIK